MEIKYKDIKEIPCTELYHLFVAVGWSDANETTDFMIEHFNAGFVNSTFVYSAWIDDRLIGCVRVLSDMVFRSIIYDLAVLPEYQHMGIGKELVSRCRQKCPKSEWLVQTDSAKEFYEKIGFIENKDDFLTIKSEWF